MDGCVYVRLALYSKQTPKEEDTHLDNTSFHTSTRSGRRTFSWFLLILANVLWAGSYVAGKFALSELSVNMVNALRMSIAALVLLPLLIARRKDLHLTRRDLPQLALLALFGFVINKILEYGGLALTTASDVALLITGESIVTAVLSWLLLRERFRLRAGFSLLLGFQALLIKHSPLLVTAAAIVGSTIFWIPVTGFELLRKSWHPMSWQAWAGLFWLALMSTVVSYLAWFKGLEKIEGTAAATTLFTQPLLGTALAILLLGEQLLPTTMIGGVLILASVSVISRPERSHSKKPNSDPREPLEERAPVRRRKSGFVGPHCAHPGDPSSFTPRC